MGRAGRVKHVTTQEPIRRPLLLLLLLLLLTTDFYMQAWRFGTITLRSQSVTYVHSMDVGTNIWSKFKYEADSTVMTMLLLRGTIQR
jgi:hypothetical protein